MPPIKFEYDSGNILRSEVKHGITNVEAESGFEDADKLNFYDFKHSADEIRYFCLGESFMQRVLYIVYHHRKSKIRIISARVASSKNKMLYESQ